jgi:hypothetical protein
MTAMAAMPFFPATVTAMAAFKHFAKHNLCPI